MDKLRIGKKALTARKFTPDHPDPEISTSHGFSLFLFSKYTQMYRDVIADNMRRNNERDRDPSTKELVESSADMIVACTKDWSGYEEDGKSKDYDPEILRTLLNNDEFRWVRLQAEKFIMDDRNYFGKPSKS